MNDRAVAVKRAFAVPVMLAALASIPVVILQQEARTDGVRQFGEILDWVSWSLFVVELVVMLIVVTDRQAYLRHNWLDLVVVFGSFPLYPPLFALVRLVRLRLLARLFRSLHLPRPAQAMSRAGDVSRNVFESYGLRYLAGLTVVIVVLFGILYWIVEDQPDNVFQGMWWSLVTVTTVGYGDFSPVTPVGRVIAAALMVVGIGFVATATAVIASHFVGQERRTDKQLQAMSERMERMEEQLGRMEEALRAAADD
jgi:voltage-gated potassium channel